MTPKDGVTEAAEAHEAQRLQAADLGLAAETTVDLGQGVTMDLALIPAGEFLMGSPDMEKERFSDEGPQRRVRIARPFRMGKYEVTQEQWQVVMGYNPSCFRGARNPVENVSLHDCQGFLRKLSCLGQGTFRLPTETEWEYACRARTTTPFHCGETLSAQVANYDGDSANRFDARGERRRQTTAVGSFEPNAWGLYDMHGNVWEWCDSLFQNYAPNADTGFEDPCIRERRVLRGGCWDNRPRYCRSACRGLLVPWGRNYITGLRVVAD